MKILVFDTYQEASLEASNYIISQIKKKPNSILGLATGTSPIELYNNLIEANKDHQVSFKNIKTFNLDEYVGISQEHEQSYYQFMFKHLFRHIDIDQNNIHMPNNQMETLHDNAKKYNLELNKQHIDLQVLGIGSNGHIGFNEPGTSFDQETFIVKLDERTRIDNKRFFASLDEVPKYAITMGIKNIMLSRKIILLAFGSGKAKSVKEMVEGKITTSLPASALQLHPDVIVLLDRAAASELSAT